MDAQPSRLAQAGSWYLQAVDAVPADGWAKPTLCEGWTARHLVAHVASGDQLFNGDNRTGWIGACSLRLRGLYKAGTYKFTLKKDASFKDIFGTAYTQAADQSITFTVVDAPAPVQCL